MTWCGGGPIHCREWRGLDGWRPTLQPCSVSSRPAAAAIVSLGIGSAYAGDGEGPAGGYVDPGVSFRAPSTLGPDAGAERAGAARSGYAHLQLAFAERRYLAFPPSEAGGGSN